MVFAMPDVVRIVSSQTRSIRDTLAYIPHPQKDTFMREVSVRVVSLLAMALVLACASSRSESGGVDTGSAASGDERPAAKSAPSQRAPSEMRSGEQLVETMHERYNGKWPRNVTFVQTTTFYQGDSTRVETWYEAIEPGKLRIDFAPLENGNAALFRGDSLYQFKAGKLAGSLPLIHPLMVLSRDVYEEPVQKTVSRLEQLNFDLAKVREDTWQGRPVYVVGADAGDEKSPQFWVDQESLLFVRLIEPSNQDPSVIEETQFNKYQRLGGGWIETEVVFLRNGKPFIREEYRDMRADVRFDADLFNPQKWAAPGWVKG
jgi:hypothetical protein